MRYLVAVAILTGLGGFPSAATANTSCPTDMYRRADASLINAANAWGSLSKHQKVFGSCDDGALSEGYSDAVVRLLAYRWNQFDAFVDLSARNAAFRQWAIRHIDATSSTDDLTKVVRNATRCAGSGPAKELCREIATAARDALED
jgi:hypothetical protein